MVRIQSTILCRACFLVPCTGLMSDHARGSPPATDRLTSASQFPGETVHAQIPRTSRQSSCLPLPRTPPSTRVIRPCSTESTPHGRPTQAGHAASRGSRSGTTGRSSGSPSISGIRRST